jgi:uroporphyrin-III C-methyltransferase/precorrin-2 dehydrogenase/sirohydrochlorin ferrochelatase
VKAARCIEAADLVLYDALTDAEALRRLTQAQCFCVGKRAGRASVKQETIHRLMVRAARQGKRVVRLKGGDPFVFGRGAEEAQALVEAGIPFEVVPGVSTAIAAPELAGIPVTHRGVASGFLVLAGHTGEPLDSALASVQPGSLTVVFMMALAAREQIAARLQALGWPAATPAAVVCGASTGDEWTWTGTVAELGRCAPPDGLAGVVVVGEVVRVRETLLIRTPARGNSGGRQDDEPDEVRYGRS